MSIIPPPENRKWENTRKANAKPEAMVDTSRVVDTPQKANKALTREYLMKSSPTEVKSIYHRIDFLLFKEGFKTKETKVEIVQQYFADESIQSISDLADQQSKELFDVLMRCVD